jgi:hypothetical protein
MVKLPVPSSPFVPFTLNETVMVLEDGLVVILRFVICWLVMFPVTEKFIFVPFSVVAFIVAGFEVGVGVGEDVGFGAGVSVGSGSGAKTAEIVMTL